VAHHERRVRVVHPTVVAVSGPTPSSEAGHSAVVAEFEPTSRAVRDARQLAVDAAGLDDGSSGDLALAVSELATNAVLHARTPFVLRVDRDDRLVRVVVSDGSVERPELQHPSAKATTGRGLRLLEQMVDRWGVELRADGKDVWFEIAITEGASP
jgi:anti-sigma regulatory factor (Ser/Thr protein kinase)